MASSMQAVAHGANSVQYFQFRKSRGSTEKFHGAVVDHYGGSDTRVFRDVAAVGQRLEAIDAVTQSDVKAEVALVFDMETAGPSKGRRAPATAASTTRSRCGPTTGPCGAWASPWTLWTKSASSAATSWSSPPCSTCCGPVLRRS